ncbi:MAG: hypothetical protein OEV80_13455, partial [candidate division Zixibacteria bacterium]|nr:hypothetical protein [candidate division Zixibacteria bacterium]
GSSPSRSVAEVVRRPAMAPWPPGDSRGPQIGSRAGRPSAGSATCGLYRWALLPGGTFQAVKYVDSKSHLRQ